MDQATPSSLATVRRCYHMTCFFSGIPMAKRGRPCGFDREQALRRALDVFWEAGYEGATMAALKEAMGGICAPSMYAAYGSKEALFRSAVELYLSQECQLSRAPSPCRRRASRSPRCWKAPPSATPRKASRAVAWSTSARPISRRPTKASKTTCAITGGAPRACCASVSHEAWPTATCRPEPISTRLTSFYSSVLQGLSIQARDGASRQQLLAIGRCAMAAWDSCWRSRPPDATARLDWKKPMDSPWAKTITRDIELIQTPGEVLPRVSRAPAIARCRLELS